ncbi:MAG: 7-cyano-7-deazaguanine synthase [Algisphaera sp.]
MARPPLTLILNRGGLRGLIATAATLNAAGKPRVGVIFIDDGRDDAALRLEMARRQADFFGITRFDTLNLPELFAGPGHHEPDGRPKARLAAARLLLTALAHAGERKADTLVWPVAHDAQPDAVGHATEVQLLTEQLADTEPAALHTEDRGINPRLTAPLLGYTDAQLIELGRGYGVPFGLARSCQDVSGGVDGPPCRMCPPCRRRTAAFRAAGVSDLLISSS